jgi:tRNA(Ile2) C34 agmatinyltransferase TiaS
MEQTDRKPCPECGEQNPISKGIEWRCRRCGRWYKKIYRQPPHKDSIEEPVDNNCIRIEDRILK